MEEAGSTAFLVFELLDEREVRSVAVTWRQFWMCLNLLKSQRSGIQSEDDGFSGIRHL